ncbi:VOC family protein [Shewanella salipaludis]|uniref:VOC family protein n=1 Tax=Shewanella salipaludis TaxID=2723052 RepID=A0A972FQJ9_9GAMM|nr:VOC family protein [Shewanella salipaludis]NMH64315.1 VOC family protein [Shewanella salipaludis]
MNRHNSINYLEIPVKDLPGTKDFFGRVFGWQFQDYGPEYSCFLDAGITGGFYQSPQSFNLAQGCPLIVLYSAKLEQTQQDVLDAGGTLVKAIFSFPGGRRFHFSDINGNEYAVWSE